MQYTERLNNARYMIQFRKTIVDAHYAEFSIMPSVVLLICIPERIAGSWHQGQVLVGFKDAALGYSEAKKSNTDQFCLCTSADFAICTFSQA